LRLKINTEKEGGGAGDVNTYSVWPGEGIIVSW
jgi:hypothetical protein